MLVQTSKFSVLSVAPQPISPDTIFDTVFDEDLCLEVAADVSLFDRANVTNVNQLCLTYGEIVSIEPIFCLLQSCLRHNMSTTPFENGVFYDLGGGIGKPTIAMALCSKNFRSYHSIEIIEGLHQLSLIALDKFKSLETENAVISSSANVSCHHGSFLDLNVIDWTDGDLVFANSTCYNALLMDEISAIAKNMKPNSFFVSLSHPLAKWANFELVDELRCEMSWGEADLYIQRKL